MAETARFTELFQRTIDANVRFYQDFVSLTLDYYKNLGRIYGDWPQPFWMGAQPFARAEKAASPALVLEAEGGKQARGVFLVENKLSRKVTARVTASTFRDPQGKTIAPSLHFQPESVTAEPGEQVLVEVTADIGGNLEPGVRYRGELSVEGLSETSVPVVIRRRP